MNVSTKQRSFASRSTQSFAANRRFRNKMEFGSLRSSPNQFTVADFVQWNRDKTLKLNPHFQRRSVWTPDGKTYLIDSMLQGFPMPKVYLRTELDLRTQKILRDVVDGQQRIRAILAFASNELTLNKRSEQFKGLRYDQLSEHLQRSFLDYPIGIEHLLNADDDMVLEVFARLNSYTVPLNGAEKRHAAFQTDLKWRVVEITNDLRWFITKYEILTTTTMLRMQDDAFFAGLLEILLDGIGDGGEAALNAFYRRHRSDLQHPELLFERIVQIVDWMVQHLDPILTTKPLSRPYQVQMLFAAIAHQLFVIPNGKITNMPNRVGIGEPAAIVERLSFLAEALEDADYNGPFSEFVEASSKATIRMPSREARFLAFSDAIVAR